MREANNHIKSNRNRARGAESCDCRPTVGGDSGLIPILMVEIVAGEPEN